MSLVIGLSLAVLLSLLPLPPGSSFFAAVLFGTLAALGLKWPQIASYPYRVWNRLAREFSRFARFWLTSISFYIIVFSVGRGGSRLRTDGPTASESLWMPRNAFASECNPLRSPTSDGIVRRSCAANYVSWCVRSGNLWAICLLPFIVLLATFDSDQQQTNVPENLYTLF
jgi:hypothetical protein